LKRAQPIKNEYFIYVVKIHVSNNDDLS